MKLGELLEVIETSQTVEIYKVADVGYCYQGMATSVPNYLKTLDVEMVHAYEWDIDILVS